MKYLSVVAYAACIMLANWMTATYGLVPIGFGLAVTAGTFAAGFALITRDWVQVEWNRWVAVAAIIIGAALSAWTSTPAIATASGIAFLVSELIDLAVFTPLRTRNLALAVLASSVVSAPIDTVLFLHLAGFGVTWQAVAGQFIVKTLIALVVAGAVSVWREKPRHA